MEGGWSSAVHGDDENNNDNGIDEDNDNDSMVTKINRSAGFWRCVLLNCKINFSRPHSFLQQKLYFVGHQTFAWQEICKTIKAPVLNLYAWLIFERDVAECRL